MSLPYDVVLGEPLIEQLPKESQVALHKACKVVPGFQYKLDQLTTYWIDPNADKDIAGTMLYNVVKLLTAYLKARV